MPQPLSRVKSDVHFVPHAFALNHHPEFAAAAMRVIALWADIDGNLAGVLANLLRTDIAAGTAMYQALTGGEAKRQALLAAAKVNLPEWQVLLLQAVLKATKPSRDQRNDFAHHIWGFSKDIPEALLLMPSSVVVERNVSWRQVSEFLPEGRGVLAPKDFDRSRIFVYREADFKRASDEAATAYVVVSYLYSAIGQAPHEQARRLLLNEPLIQQALQSMIRESSPEVRAQLSPPGDDAPAKGVSEDWDCALGRL